MRLFELIYHYLFSAYILLGLFFNLKSQNPALNFKRITVNDGLASNEVYHILEDKRGFKWFATDGGISKFDGKTFKNFNRGNGLKENTIFGLYEDFEGKIWYRGINALIGYIKDDSIYNIDISNYLKSQIGSKFVSSICVSPDKELYLGFHSAKYQFIKVDYPYLRNNISDSAIFFLHDSVYASLTRIDQNVSVASLSPFNIFAGRISNGVGYFGANINANRFRSVFKFIVSKDFGNMSIFKHIKVNEKLDIFSVKSILLLMSDTISEVYFPSPILFLAKYDETHFIVSTISHGIFLFDLNTKRYSRFNNVDEEYITSVLIDRENNIWFSAKNRGVFCSRGGLIQTLNFAPNSVSDFKVINNNCLVLMDNSQFNFYSLREWKLIDRIQFWTTRLTTKDIHNSLLFFNKSSFFSGNHIINIDTNSNKIIKEKLENYVSVAPVLGQNKEVFYGNKYAIIKCNIETKKTVNLSEQIHPKTLYFVNSDSLLVGTNYGIEILNENLSLAVGARKLLTGRSVFRIFNDKDQFVVLTEDSGIFVLNRHLNQVKKKIFNITSSYKMRKAFFESGKLLICTNRGLVVYKDVLNSNNYFLFNKLTGLLNDEVNSASIYNDTLYVSTLDGISYFNIDSVINYKPKIPLYIDNIIIDGKTTYYDTLTRVELNLPRSVKFVKVNFLFPNFKNAEGRKYYYKLNDDTAYTEINDDFLLLDRLQPGKLNVHVYAQTAEGFRSINDLKLSINVAKAFWETWWFYAILYFLLALLAYLGIRLWLNKREKREKEKANLLVQIVELQSQALSLQMNPHFIFNAINSIQNFILKANQDQAYNYLTKFSKLIRKVLEVSRKEVTTLSEELQIVEWNCELEALRFDEEFSFELMIAESVNLNETLLPSLTLQPYVENAIWHGLARVKGKKHLKVLVEGNDDRILVKIEDNGIGIKESARLKLTDQSEGLKKQSLAMCITKQRIDNFNLKFNTSIQIEVMDKSDVNKNDNGTLVKIVLPLNINV